jgi:hypothetical protein
MAAPVTQMTGNGLTAVPLSSGEPTFFTGAGAAMSGSPPLGVAGMVPNPVPLRPANYSPVTNLRDNPPCNTLFIGNLGDNTNEQELRTLLCSQPGYRCESALWMQLLLWVAAPQHPSCNNGRS